MREAVDSSRQGARLARVGAVLSAIFAIAAAAPAEAPRTGAPSVGAPKAPAYTTVTDPPPEEPAPAGPAKTTFPWRNLEGKFWQVVAAAPEDPRITDLREGTRGACATGMVEVAGRMKDDSGDYFG
ncbi:MAG: hypothetical protein JNM74_02840, partial [Myxococcales bacterium]|nr:hypothetical protein [Myxococcales bacterium]